MGERTWSVGRLKLPFDDMVELHCPSGDILFGSQCTSTCDGGKSCGLCVFTLKVTVVVTVKLFCGVEGFDHLGGGGGGVFETNSFLGLMGSLLGSMKLIKFRVLGRVGLLSLVTGVDGSAVLNVVIRGFKFNTRSASGLEAAEGGGLYLETNHRFKFSYA